ncbi:MAG: hypothetical protein ABSH15_02900 [Verrucomicrobiota bacterium]|jgi:hypothetical protein
MEIWESGLVACLSAEKKSATEMGKLIKKLTLTIAVLDSDVTFAANEWRKEPSNQFWRRTLIRCVCAQAEGTLGLLKNITPDSANFFDVNLTAKDIEVATERRAFTENGITKTKPVFLPFPENVKETFKVFTKAHATQVVIKYDEEGFGDLCNTFEVRNKLMHPKGPFDVEVRDRAIDAADRGINWFGSVLRRILAECGKKLPFSQNNLNN